MQITMTIPDRIGQALANRARELDQASPEYLKQFLFAACHSPGGVVLKLDLPPLPKQEVPLFDNAGVTIEEAQKP